VNPDYEKHKRIVFVFLSISGNRFSRTLNYYHGLLRRDISCYWIDVDPNHKMAEIRKVVKDFNSKDTIFVVASPSHVLVPYLKLLTRKRIVLDAGWPLYDGVIQSRNLYGLFGWRFIFTYFIDFLSFHVASRVFLESNSQIKASKRRYFLPNNKLLYLATGFDETRFSENTPQGKNASKDQGRVVLFRGGAQEEAGLNVLFEAIKLVNSHARVRFIVVSKMSKEKTISQEGLEILREFQDDAVLWDLYKGADIVLGQLSDHARLDKTLPHKFFEAGYFGKPYLSSNRGEIGNFISLGNIVGFAAGNARDLAAKIDELLNSPSTLEKHSKAIAALYRKDFSQDVLVGKFLHELT
jgi:glycosyltransferase involved in cell wall biosynthesis